jgi:hypothetical protein
MIRSFADEQTERLFHWLPVKKLGRAVLCTALRRLVLLDVAEALEDRRSDAAPPAEAGPGPSR